MRKKTVTVNFNIALSALYTFAMAKIGFMLRDLVEFIKYGVTEEKLNALKAMLTDFANIPTDDELVGVQVSATQEKDEAAIQLRDAIAEIMQRVENKFGAQSGNYRKFGVSGVSDLDGGKLSYVTRRVHRVAETMLPQLESEGLTPELLTELNSRLDTYEQALSKQEDAIADRDIATENRVEKANEIYALLVKYCNTGKQIWEDTNQAKYNDYIIYDTPTGKPKDKDNQEVLSETEQ
ncbi:hypothetical protein [Sunxiuqinia elliptica]|uniref:Uncharacterized protein n=1 Tax=Sunxiuqinia elliptica TaxID=655355 RepID=A0A1I2LRM0_9BACT|nr:hypothetical protein [Sunxiuqinia elliptica]SFF81925.1 hypothetical protein SAMN05216283_1178 [Sunxiuqinia elliptica]